MAAAIDIFEVLKLRRRLAKKTKIISIDVLVIRSTKLTFRTSGKKKLKNIKLSPKYNPPNSSELVRGPLPVIVGRK